MTNLDLLYRSLIGRVATLGEVAGVRFRVLGALNVFDGKDWLDVGAAKWRSLLAALVVRAPDVVSMDQLVLELWGDRPPRTATAQVYGYVLRLRRLLGDHDGRLLRTLAPGYPARRRRRGRGFPPLRLRSSSWATRRCSAGRADAGDVLRQALALWRGPALVDVAPTPLISAEASRLEELRLVAWEARVDADLARGRHATLIGELRRHVDEHPLRERPWGQLMLALHRSGRQAESLRTFQRVRRILVEEVGAEPGAELRRIQQRLLSGDLPDEVEVHTRPAAPLCQLPSDVADFTGREPQLRELLTRLPDRAEHGPPPVVVVRGGPGVGKSTLAVHAAHQVTSRFPDGQLYLDLAGTSDEPRETGGAARRAAARAWRDRCRRAGRGGGDGRRCSARCWPAGRSCSCSTTPPTASRSARCCRPPAAARCW